jgi:hypothetical protein
MITKAFAVGINQFEDASSNLRGCVNDMMTMRDYLLKEKSFDPRYLRCLSDMRAKRSNVFARLDWCGRGWPQSPDPKDCKLSISLSCHGTQYDDRDGDEVEDGLDEALCPYDFPELWDSPNDAPDVDVCEHYLGRPPRPQLCDDDLGEFLKRIPKGVYVALMIDACHSGSIDRNINPHNSGKPRFVQAPIDIRARSMDRVLEVRRFGVKPGVTREVGPNPNVHYVDQNHVLLSGCRDDQTSADANIGGVAQGAMTWAFSTSLHESSDKTWLGVHDYMLKLLVKYGYDQVPQLSGPKEMLEGLVFGG